jgi:hypothetical protein
MCVVPCPATRTGLLIASVLPCIRKEANATRSGRLRSPGNAAVPTRRGSAAPGRRPPGSSPQLQGSRLRPMHCPWQRRLQRGLGLRRRRAGRRHAHPPRTPVPAPRPCKRVALAEPLSATNRRRAPSGQLPLRGHGINAQCAPTTAQNLAATHGIRAPPGQRLPRSGPVETLPIPLPL